MHAFTTVIKFSFCAAALAAVSLPAQSAPVPKQGTWTTTLQARDLNNDRVVDAYFDSDLNITWLANWNLNGLHSWNDANSWATGLNLYGVTGWRLPSTVDAPSSYNLKPPVWSSEMAHMFYSTLGNKGYPDSGAGLGNTGRFVNMQGAYTDSYWSGTQTTQQALNAWRFQLSSGYQSYQPETYLAYAVAVRDGDVTAIPEPQALLMMLAGLGVIGFVVRRLKH